MKKAIVVAHNSRFVVQFELRNISLLQSLGYEVHCATNFENEESILDAKEQIEATGAILHQFDIERFCFHPRVLLKNIIACGQLKKILQEEFDIVHCHTPIGGVVARIAAAKMRKKGTKVIYTAHGFHFFKGAPLLNWLIYYPVEWALAHITDVLITINKEDYARAQKFKAKKVCYVPGVGIDFDRMNRGCLNARKTLRDELGIPQESTVVLSVGEVNKNKNHRTIIKAIAQIENKNIWYVICGNGPLIEEHRKLAHELGIGNRIILTGYQENVEDYYRMSDIFAFPSFREGLGLAAIEAMASGRPLITSNIHGINDYSMESATGNKCDPEDVAGFAKAIQDMIDHPEKREEYALNNQKAAQEYDYRCIREKIKVIYENVNKTFV